MKVSVSHGMVLLLSSTEMKASLEDGFSAEVVIVWNARFQITQK